MRHAQGNKGFCQFSSLFLRERPRRAGTMVAGGKGRRKGGWRRRNTEL